MLDTVVIGAGPAGSRVARKMAENGFSTIVIEKKKLLDEPVCCTGIVGRECIDHFDIDSSVIVREAYSASVFSPSGNILRVERPEPQASILDRSALNRYLGELAIDAGAGYIMNTRATGIISGADSVIVETESDGKYKRYETRTVVIADGFGSKLAQEAGFGKAKDFAMGVQAEVEAHDIREVEVFLGNTTAPGFFGWLVPTGPGKALAGLISRHDTGSYMKKFLASLIDSKKIPEQQPHITFSGVALQDTKKTSTDRIISVGSAAGQVKPLTGGGVYFGMLCADIAAEILCKALSEDDVTARNLVKYDKIWKRTIGREIMIGHWGRRFYESLSDRRIDSLVKTTVSRGIDKTLLESTDLRFDWHSAVILRLLRFKTAVRILKGLLVPLHYKR